MPVVTGEKSADYLSDRDIIFKILFQLRREVEELKQKVESGNISAPAQSKVAAAKLLIDEIDNYEEPKEAAEPISESVSLQDATRELIIKALERNGGKRQATAQELGFSERTLYRKIKELNLE